MNALISVVVPVFDEEECIVEFQRRITKLGHSLPSFDFEFIYVDDGSTDLTNNLLKENLGISGNCQNVLITLSRNFGHQAAIECGMRASRGAAVITIDADLQDPPEVIASMLDKFKSGFDIVLAKRINRAGESVFKKSSAKIWYRLINSLSDTNLSKDVGDFRLISRLALNSLLQIEEANPYYRGLVSWIGFKSTEVAYTRDPRHAGKTKYTFRKMWNLAINGLTNFSLRPLRIPFFASLLTIPFALVLTCFLIYERIRYPEKSVPGYTSLVIILLWSFGIQMFTLGVIGEYLAKNFTQSKGRPRYLIASETIGRKIE